MRIRMLGPLEVVAADDSALHVAGVRLRRLLIALALEPGRVLPAEQLVDAVWGEDPPAGAANALQALVSRLRRALPGVVVEGVPSGYRLAMTPDDVDVARFEQLVATGRAQLTVDPAAAVRVLGEAVALWRGQALFDVRNEQFFAAPRVRLEDMRLVTAEDRATALVQLGRAAEAVGELAAAATANPLRERLTAALMRALAAAGRPADALLSYERTREALADELGTDPSPELSALHTAVLRGKLTPSTPEPTTAASATRTNLPAGLTSFVGRDADVARVGDLVVEYRLATLVGSGGVGKTRLAVEATRSLVDRTPDGVWLVELAPVTDPADLPSAVLAAMGLRDSSAVARDLTDDPTDRLVSALRPRSALLVLDNCEHLIDAAATLAERLLRACPGLRLLATSREPLGIAGEAVWPVEPLTLPPATRDDEAELLEYDAVRLLVDRARAARPRFALADDTTAVAWICRALDGMPLAIELAAARLRAMTPVQLADRLDDRFGLLTGGSRTAMPRHQTLRAVVDWSWDLLTEPERAVLRRFAIFAGGATLESAERVCAGPPVAAADVLGLLTGLVDKSLVVEDAKGDVSRYRMLETIKAYALDHLAAAGEQAATRRAHADAMVDLAETAEPHLRRSEQLTWIRRLAAEHDDLTAALRGAIAAGDAQTAVRIVAAAAWYWWQRGHKAEGLELAMEALRVPGDTDPDARATTCATVAFFTTAGLGDPRAVEPWVEETRRLAATLDQPGPLVRFIVSMAEAFREAYRPGESATEAMEQLLSDEDPWVRAQTRLARNRALDIDERVPDIELGLAEFRSAGDRWGMCYALSMMAAALALRGELTAAIGHAEHAVTLLSEMDNVEDYVLITSQLAQLSWMCGDRDAAVAHLARAERAAPKVVWRDGLALFALVKADMARWAGDTATARSELAHAQAAVGDMVVDAFFGAMIQNSHAFLDAAAGDLDSARARRREALATTFSTGDSEFLAQVLTGVADQAIRQGAAEAAVRLLAAGAAVIGTLEACVGDGAEVSAAARAALGDVAFTTAMTQAYEEWAGMRTGEPAAAEAVRELAASVLDAE